MKRILLLLCCVLFLGVSCNKVCRDGHKFITVENNSSYNVYVFISKFFPDTSLFGIGNPQKSDFVEKESTNRVCHRDWYTCYEETFKYSMDTMMVFFIDADLFDTISKDIIISDYLILKRYDLSLADLEEMNWTITYP